MDYIASLIVDPAAWAAFLALVVMEIVLGIDNLLFISILTNKLPEADRGRARRIGISLALILRLALLGTVAFLVLLKKTVFFVFDKGFSWRDIILIAGGLFLVWKATKEIHHSVDPQPAPDVFDAQKVGLGFASAITQILLLDMVFSVDSILTAVGMTDHIPIMVAAVIIAVTVMMRRRRRSRTSSTRTRLLRCWRWASF
jgi:predicted tellurium resistance membrane protein TerC